MLKPDGQPFIASEFIVSCWADDTLSSREAKDVGAYVLDGKAPSELINDYVLGKDNMSIRSMTILCKKFALAPADCQGGITQNADWIANGGYYGIMDKENDND